MTTLNPSINPNLQYKGIKLNEFEGECRRFLKVISGDLGDWRQTHYLRRYGICQNVTMVFRGNGPDDEGNTRKTINEMLGACFVTWNCFSGNIDYPVPSDHDEWNAADCFDNCDDLYEDEQLKMRVDLLNHVIAELNKGEEFLNRIPEFVKSQWKYAVDA